MFLWQLSNKQLIHWLWDKAQLPVVFILLFLLFLTQQTWILVLLSVWISAIFLADARLCWCGSTEVIHRVMKNSRFLVKSYTLMRNHWNDEAAFQAIMANRRLRRCLAIEMYVFATGTILVVLISLAEAMGYIR